MELVARYLHAVRGYLPKAQADDIIMRRNYYAGGHTFVHQRGMRRR